VVIASGDRANYSGGRPDIQCGAEALDMLRIFGQRFTHGAMLNAVSWFMI
jgi:hypothetical protein